MRKIMKKQTLDFFKMMEGNTPIKSYTQKEFLKMMKKRKKLMVIKRAIKPTIKRKHYEKFN